MGTLYTPHNAYKWLIAIGIDHDNAVKLTESRAKFEYFVAVLRCL